MGSRPKKITAEKRSRGREPIEQYTTELFISGPRQAYRDLEHQIPEWELKNRGAEDMLSFEDIAVPTVGNKVKGRLKEKSTLVLEVVLHADEERGENVILPEFKKYLEFVGLNAELDRRFYAGGLCFVELAAPAEKADEIATFTTVRALRQMPKLRVLSPTIRSSTIPAQSLQLPNEGPLDSNIKVAVLDGGIPDDHPLTAWVTPIDASGIGEDHPELTKHGVGVSSALLFGHINPKDELPRPYSRIDHYRVLDDQPGRNPHELYDVLERIERILSSNSYDFVNLSFGPRLPIEDDDVHAWTAVLDDRLSRAKTLGTIAVGNDGECDAELGLNRIQVPSDCVNALSVGACDSLGSNWRRAPYSSVGPGRSPGLIKPDLVAFGGTMERPFLVVSDGTEPTLDTTGGTSFSAPSTLRLATGIRAHFGEGLNELAIKALLVHTAEESDLDRQHVGWGRLATNLSNIVVCDDDMARIVYQGEISPAKYIRAGIPTPLKTLEGMVSISATLCFKCRTDPHHPGNYTRAGPDVTFRPHDEKFKKNQPDQVHPNSKPFFGASVRGKAENELRRDALKWENCLNAQKNMRGSSLKNPCFDIHYNSRLESKNFQPGEPLRYALVVTMKAKKAYDLYDQVVRKYSNQLEALTPTIEVPIRM